jgi:hypothetical protein
MNTLIEKNPNYTIQNGSTTTFLKGKKYILTRPNGSYRMNVVVDPIEETLRLRSGTGGIPFVAQSRARDANSHAVLQFGFAQLYLRRTIDETKEKSCRKFIAKLAAAF